MRELPTDNRIASRLLAGASWSMAGAVCAQGVTLLASIPVARMLGAEGYGAFGLVQTTLNTVAVLTGPALTTVVASQVAMSRSTDRMRAGAVAAEGLRAAFLFGMLGTVLVAVLGQLGNRQSGPLGYHLVVGATAVLGIAIFSAQVGILSGVEDFRAVAFLSLLRSLSISCLTVLGAWLWGLLGTVVGLTLGSFVAPALALRRVRRALARQSIALRRDAAGIDSFLLFRSRYLPAAVSGGITLWATWFASVYLSSRPQGLEHLGLFSAANNWRLAVGFIPSVIAQPFLAVISDSYGRAEEARQRALLMQQVAFASATALAVGLTAGAFSGHLMGVYGTGFSGSDRVLGLLLVAAVLAAPSAALGTFLMATDKMWQATALNALWALVLLTVCFSSSRFTALSLAASYAVAYSVHLISSATYIWVTLKRHGRPTDDAGR